MKNENIYRQWRHSRKQVATSPDFRLRVMGRIAREAETDTESWPALIERISLRPWAQAAAIAAAALLGVGRILLTLHVLLFA